MNQDSHKCNMQNCTLNKTTAPELCQERFKPKHENKNYLIQQQHMNHKSLRSKALRYVQK